MARIKNCSNTQNTNAERRRLRWLSPRDLASVIHIPNGINLLQVRTNVIVSFRPGVTNDNVLKCVDDLITLVRQSLKRNTTTTGTGSCPANFTFTIEKAEKTGVSFSNCCEYRVIYNHVNYMPFCFP
jgi:hypothetical protein